MILKTNKKKEHKKPLKLTKQTRDSGHETRKTL
jgi:hypothetical protein